MGLETVNFDLATPSKVLLDTFQPRNVAVISDKRGKIYIFFETPSFSSQGAASQRLFMCGAPAVRLQLQLHTVLESVNHYTTGPLICVSLNAI